MITSPTTSLHMQLTLPTTSLYTPHTLPTTSLHTSHPRTQLPPYTPHTLPTHMGVSLTWQSHIPPQLLVSSGMHAWVWEQDTHSLLLPPLPWQVSWSVLTTGRTASGTLTTPCTTTCASLVSSRAWENSNTNTSKDHLCVLCYTRQLLREHWPGPWTAVWTTGWRWSEMTRRGGQSEHGPRNWHRRVS